MDIKMKKTLTWTAFATVISAITYTVTTGSPAVLPTSIALNAIVYPVSYYIHEKWWGRKNGD